MVPLLTRQGKMMLLLIVLLLIGVILRRDNIRQKAGIWFRYDDIMEQRAEFPAPGHRACSRFAARSGFVAGPRAPLTRPEGPKPATGSPCKPRIFSPAGNAKKTGYLFLVTKKTLTFVNIKSRRLDKS